MGSSVPRASAMLLLFLVNRSMNTKSGLSVRFWVMQFRKGTIFNEIRSNQKKAIRFFGALPVMRGNMFELYTILVARQILVSSNEELEAKISSNLPENKVQKEPKELMLEDNFDSKFQ